MEKLQLNEIFYSIQGEGLLAGTCSVFIRLPGCPLRCSWCDTKYALSPTSGKTYTYEQILDYLHTQPCSHVVVTGGEPITNPNLPNLLKILKSENMHVTLETAGIKAIQHLPCDLMSISPKLSNSTPENPELAREHEKIRLNIPAIKELISEYKYQLKLVVNGPEDFDEIAELLEKLAPLDPDRVLLMPQAATRDEYIQKAPFIAETCLRAGFGFSPRLQLLLWQGRRGK